MKNLVSIIHRHYGPDLNSETLPEGLTTFLNPYSYLIARKHKELFQKMDHIFIDGILLVKLLNLLKVVSCRRIAFDMSNLAPFVFSYAQKNHKTIFFIGAKPDEIGIAIMNIRNEFPGLKVIGHRHGYFGDRQEKEEVLEHIAVLRPDLVVVGMGIPLQERFLLDLKAKRWLGTGFTCGGFLHQAAKRIKYYPDWMYKIYINVLVRLYYEPKLLKRYFFQYPMFFVVFLYDYLKFRLDLKM